MLENVQLPDETSIIDEFSVKLHVARRINNPPIALPTATSHRALIILRLTSKRIPRKMPPNDEPSGWIIDDRFFRVSINPAKR
jgi:hypothetical protein